MVRISDAELEVMKVIWKKGEITSAEIISELKDFNWNDNTVRTLINRLISKKAIEVSKLNGKTYTYKSLINENQYKLKRTKNFISQFYDGSLKDMLLNFISTEEISKEELKKILNQIEDD